MTERKDLIERLTARERDVLSLIGTGHDAKSAAATLGLSVHTVNERLRDARRTLGVTSSRAAARLLAEAEGGAKKFGDESFGVVTGAAERELSPAIERRRRVRAGWGGVLLMSLILAASAFFFVQGHAPTAPRVIQMMPAPGAEVSAGPVEVRVTFDRPMRADGWSFVNSSRGRYPSCGGVPSVSRDGRSFSLRCTVTSGERYAVGFNGGRFLNFRSAADGASALPAETWFFVR